MDRLDLSDQPSGYAAYREPPKRKRNALRAVLILVSCSLLSGLFFFGFFLYYQRPHTTQPTPKEPITKQELNIPYPQTKQAVARQFGGRPASWHKVGTSDWHYDGTTPIALTVGNNVHMWTFHAGLHWPASDAQQKG